MNLKNDSSGIVMEFIIVLLAIFIFPLVTIWSLNVLFGMSIPYTFETWFAMFWLHVFIVGSAKANIK